MSTAREHLRAYETAALTIERVGLVIDILEGTRGAYRMARRCIVQCKREQQVQLRRLDAAAAKLGAPYGGASS